LLRIGAGNVALVVAYVGAAALALKFDPVGGIAGLVWPSSGIALAAVRLFGTQLLPAVFVGELLVMRGLTTSALVGATAALADTVEIWLAVLVLRRVSGRDPRFEGLRHVTALIAVAVLTPLVSATVSSVSLVAGGVVPRHLLLETARAWWVGNSLGDVIVAPLLLSWATIRRIGAPPWRAADLVITVALLALAVFVVFFDHATSEEIAISYLLFPILIWSAYRFRVPGAVTATALVSALALWGTVRGSGPFYDGTLAHRLLGLQLFLGCAALSSLVLAGAVDDRARALQARDEFLAIASHELRTPLAALLLQIDGLLRFTRSDGPPVVATRLERAAASGRRLERLIGQLLDVSRLSGGQMVLAPEPASLATIIHDAVDRVLGGPSARGDTPVVLHVEQDVVGRWDRDRIEQVVTNLVANALKYGRGRPVEVGLSFDGDAVLSVTDHGIGIAPERQPHVFQKFDRAITARELGGLGLGLWISRKIVEASGGRIDVRSELGQGSSFIVRLPTDTPLAESEGRHDG
jgi:signal transduction histidine kinase